MKYWIAVGWFFSTLGLAKANNQQQVDSILDRLERKLLESKQESMLLNDNWNQPIRKPRQEKTFKGKPQVIEAVLPNQDNLKEISEAIDKIEDEAERLSGDIEKLKQIIGKETQNLGYVEIYISVSDPSQISLRDMEVLLNDFTIYKLSPELGLWLPRKKIPIFMGPLKPGDHRIHLTGRISKPLDRDQPIDSNIFYLFNQDFKINVAEGDTKKSLSIMLDKIEGQNFQAKARIIEKSM